MSSAPVAFTPQDERNTLNQLPERFSREEITKMVDALRSDVANDDPATPSNVRVHKHAHKHKVLLVAMPMLYRTICKGTYRQEVIDAILDARDAMDNGLTKEQGLEKLIKTAVDNVNSFRGNVQRPPL
jgi:hypothetical protein